MPNHLTFKTVALPVKYGERGRPAANTRCSSHLLTIIGRLAMLPPEMNRAWDEWVDPANPPRRACIGATLEGKDLVEILVTAAQ